MATLGDVLVLVHDASSRARPAQLTVTEWRHDYASPEGAYAVGIRERASDDADTPPEIVDNGPTAAPQFVVSLVQAGTWVELSGAERELLLAFSRELLPAPTGPPSL